LIKKLLEKISTIEIELQNNLENSSGRNRTDAKKPKHFGRASNTK